MLLLVFAEAIMHGKRDTLSFHRPRFNSNSIARDFAERRAGALLASNDKLVEKKKASYLLNHHRSGHAARTHTVRARTYLHTRAIPIGCIPLARRRWN